MRGQQSQNTSTIEVNDIFETMWQHSFSNKQQIEILETHNKNYYNLYPKNLTEKSIQKSPNNSTFPTKPPKNKSKNTCKPTKQKEQHTASTKSPTRPHSPKSPRHCGLRPATISPKSPISPQWIYNLSKIRKQKNTNICYTAYSHFLLFPILSHFYPIFVIQYTFSTH